MSCHGIRIRISPRPVAHDGGLLLALRAKGDARPARLLPGPGGFGRYNLEVPHGGVRLAQQRFHSATILFTGIRPKLLANHTQRLRSLLIWGHALN